MISFEHSSQQKKLELKFRRLARKSIQPLSLVIDAAKPGPVDPAYLGLIAAENLNAFFIPKEYGGRPLDFLTLSLVTEEIGYGCAGLASIYVATLHAVSALLICGSREQKQTYLPGLLGPEGKVASCCITEEKGGTDTSYFSTTAHRDGDHYVINGEKGPIINAGSAAFYVVWASTDAARGRAGIGTFIIPAGTPGVVVGPYHEKPGLRCAPTATVSFKDAVVPASNLIGLPSSGYHLLMQTLDWGRAFFGAICVGLARAAHDEAIRFARQRVISNRPIIENQGVSFPLAEQATTICAARLLTWRACRMMDLNMHYTKESSMAKLFAAETVAHITNEGMLLLGQRGYSGPTLMAKFQRDAHALRVLEGTGQVQKMIIASQL